MLRRLYIQNYAIIEEIEIDFSSNLNIITGETGAGKSILMGALSLILGDRADSAVLLNRSKKCFVEGVFNVDNKKEVKTYLRKNDLDADDEVVLRREINPNGKSRAFVNDTPVNLEQLRTISSMLVDLHRQFDTLSLGEADFQREVLDALANNFSLLQQYKTVFQQWQHSNRELEELEQQKNVFTKEFDYNKFLFDELEDAGLKDNELEEIEAELKILSNAEGIKSVLEKVSYQFSEGEQPVIQSVKSLQQQLSGVSSFHNGIEELVKRLHSSQIELQDIADEVVHINNQVNYDPRKIDELNNRMATGYKLLKKHGVQTTADLLELKDSLEQKLQSVLNIDGSRREIAI